LTCSDTISGRRFFSTFPVIHCCFYEGLLLSEGLGDFFPKLFVANIIPKPGGSIFD
jgi:hypothetical protein